MKVGIGLKVNAYTPEAYAYEKYLISKGAMVQLDNEALLFNDNDINIYFMGFRPFWNRRKGRAIEIHEYHSLSTGTFSATKDRIKGIGNNKPEGRIFLNKTVHKKLKFYDKKPYIYRDMGVDRALFQVPDTMTEYDVVYAGSIYGRIGLIDELLKLAEKGIKILVIGDVEKINLARFKKYRNVFFTGRVTRDELPSLFKKCRFGLNYTPNIYPLNIQTSTKTLEYLASGLVVISNRYDWANNFFKREPESVLWLDEFDMFFHTEFKVMNVERFSWENILNEASFFDFIKRFV